MRQKAYFRTTQDGKELEFRESLGQTIFVSILYAIGYSCFVVAVLNLLFVRPLYLSGTLSSLAWIAIITTIVVSDCRKHGIRQHFVNVLGQFIRNRFAEMTTNDSGAAILNFGYKIASSRLYFLKLHPTGITTIDWGPGQGNIPEKDNNWNVALWFDVKALEFDGVNSIHGIYIVGPSGSRSSREHFGTAFIDFLRANHVPLVLPPRHLLGQEADVTEPLRPFGKIRVGQDEYVARPIERLIDAGCRVQIEEIRGTSLYVRQVKPNLGSPKP